MAQGENTHLRDPERLQEVANAMGGGIILVDADGKIVWLDRETRRRVNGELKELTLPLTRADAGGLDCFAAPLKLTVNGMPLEVCVVQQADEPQSSNDLMAAIENLVADGTSWFSAAMEKLKAMRQGGEQEPVIGSQPVGLDMLTNREREVLGLICEGKSDAHMSELLGLSENTVRNHIASLYRKIGVKRRTAAIIWARERGITDRASVVRGGRNGHGRSANY